MGVCHSHMLPISCLGNCNCRRTSEPHPPTLVSPSGQVSPSPRTGEPPFSSKSKGSFLPLLATPYVTPWLVTSQGQSKSELNLKWGLSLSMTGLL